MKVKLLLIFIVFVFTACGIKGSPRPPDAAKKELSDTVIFEIK